MADDIDDLLDEVETKYCEASKVKSKFGYSRDTGEPRRTKKSQNDRKSHDEELDDILNDIQVYHDKQPARKTNSDSEDKSSKFRPESARRCFPVYLGGSDSKCGLGNSLNQLSCDNLRCTSCDFTIVSFNNYSWSPETDYLFLRNNAPDFSRLKSNLVSKKGSRAYCCQCCHRSISRTVAVNDDKKLKWVCGKH